MNSKVFWYTVGIGVISNIVMIELFDITGPVGTFISALACGVAAAVIALKVTK
jgi:hypothetical protein